MPPSTCEWLTAYMSALPTGLHQVTNELQATGVFITAIHYRAFCSENTCIQKSTSIKQHQCKIDYKQFFLNQLTTKHRCLCWILSNKNPLKGFCPNKHPPSKVQHSLPDKSPLYTSLPKKAHQASSINCGWRRSCLGAGGRTYSGDAARLWNSLCQKDTAEPEVLYCNHHLPN